MNQTIIQEPYPQQQTRLAFASDYQEGAHPAILKKLLETNLLSTPGYGTDAFCASARERIREACGCPSAAVEFLIGGTQTNATVIAALLASYQGVVAADSGHVSVHEAGAIEYGGHKVLTLPGKLGKLSADSLEQYISDFWKDGNHDHMVMPGMVYLSQPTEFGTLYSREELQQIHTVCRKFQIPLYVDGARLAYALASPANDVQLQDLAALCDVFYIGGTKCGALLGEAVVIPDPELIPHFFTIIKQHGALLAKGRLLGIQFDELFRDRLYCSIGSSAVAYAGRIQQALVQNGYRLLFESPTNQVFFLVRQEQMEALSEKAEFSFWEKFDDQYTVIRFATSWATTEENVQALCNLIRDCAAV